MQLKTSRTLRCFFELSIPQQVIRSFLTILVIAVGTFSNAYSWDFLADSFNSPLNTCLTCHEGTTYNENDLNCYGADYLDPNHASKYSSKHRSYPGKCTNCHGSYPILRSNLNSLDSDADGFNNSDELSAGTFPGDPASVPLVVDTTAPNITAFFLPTTSTDLTVDIISFNASDNMEVTGYLVTESDAVPDISDTAWKSTPTAFYTFTSEGYNTLYAWARDEAGNISECRSDSVDITLPVVNHPPEADAGQSQTVVPGAIVTLDGNGSIDADGDMLIFYWKQTSGSAVSLSDPTAVQPTFTAPDEGALTFELTVSDGTDTSKASCVVNVTNGNLPPAAVAGSNQTVQAGDTVYLDGSQSSDPENDLASFYWIQKDNGARVSISDAASAKPYFTAPSVGPSGASLIFELTVTDGNGLKSTDTCNVQVILGNEVPLAHAGANQTVEEGGTVTLNGTLSVDPDDHIAGYFWTQTGGKAVTLSDPEAVQPTFMTPSVDAEGTTLTFSLTVTDTLGLQATDTVTVTINDNGIEAFPEDVLTMLSYGGNPFGLKAEDAASGFSCVNLCTIDPDTIDPDTDATQRPENLIFGLLDMQFKVEAQGAAAVVTIYLPEPAPQGHKWFMYNPATGEWSDCSESAVFSADRTMVTLTLIDGGQGDNDGEADGIIRGASGLGSDPLPTVPAGNDWGADSGCFIGATACGTQNDVLRGNGLSGLNHGSSKFLLYMLTALAGFGTFTGGFLKLIRRGGDRNR